MSVFQASPKKSVTNVDVAAQMRKGHPQIDAGDRYLLNLFGRLREARGQPLRVLMIGAGTGFFAARLKRKVTDTRLVVHEDYPPAAAPLTRRLAEFADIEIQLDSLKMQPKSMDVVLSWGSHHHLPRSILKDVRDALSDDGVFILGDEFCPEYCAGEMTARISTAEVISVCDGYVLTSQHEVAAYQNEGVLPVIAVEMERLRQKKLWKWYQFVIDQAMQRDCLAVVDEELRATRDDLRTEDGDEHKMSPLIAERELALAGFTMRSRHSVGAETDDPLHSFFIYEYAID